MGWKLVARWQFRYVFEAENSLEHVMSLSIPLTPDTEARLAAKARAAGVDTSTYAAGILRSAAVRPTLDEILAPVREAFRKSGLTEDELAEALEREKHAAREAERGKPFEE
jgi:hypothetical protein